MTAASSDEAQVKREMVACATTVVALATRDKLHASYPWVVAPIQKISCLITDGGEDVTTAFAAAGVSVATV